jgi:hypothetical protein
MSKKIIIGQCGRIQIIKTEYVLKGLMKLVFHCEVMQLVVGIKWIGGETEVLVVVEALILLEVQ